MQAPVMAGEDALTGSPGMAALVGEYRRRRPEETVLYRVVQQNYRTFVALCEEEERPLPAFVRREFEKYLTYGQLSEGVGGTRIRGPSRMPKPARACARCRGELMKDPEARAEFCPTCEASGAVTLIRWPGGCVSSGATAEVGGRFPGGFTRRYRVERCVGAGAFGSVYLARDNIDGRPVAVKVFDRIESVEARERFLREGRLLADGVGLLVGSLLFTW